MAPAKKAATRRRTAAKKEPTPEIQVNRTSTEATDQEVTSAEELTKTSDGSQAEQDDQSGGYALDEAKHFLDPDGRVSAHEEATRAHAARTGGGVVKTDELTQERLQHSARTDGFKY